MMNPMKWVLSSKIQKAVVVTANPAYVGSITIDEDLMDRAGLWAGEKVLARPAPVYSWSTGTPWIPTPAKFSAKDPARRQPSEAMHGPPGEHRASTPQGTGRPDPKRW